MTKAEYLKVITIDPLVKNGEPCIRDLPITVAKITHFLRKQTSIQQLFIEYPQLTLNDIKACLAFLADKPLGTYLR